MKIPEPKKLPSGTWFIQLRLTASDGKRVSVPVSAATKKECIRAAELIKAEHRSGRRVVTPKSSKTIYQAAEDYIASRPTLSPSTITGYYVTLRNRFKEQMHRPISSDFDWQAICNLEAEECSPKTLKNAWDFVKSVLRAEGITPPKVLLPKIIPKEHPWLTPEEILIFVDAIRDEPCKIPALFALHSLRRSEILDMTWDNIDFKNGLIKVEGAAVYNKDYELVHKPLNKSAASRRIIPIMIPELLKALEAVDDKTGYIVTCYPNTLWAQINRVCEANNLPLVGVHGLRHSFASLAYHLKLDELETMRIGGWADRETMHKIYTHLSELDKARAENKIAKFFQNANDNANVERIS